MLVRLENSGWPGDVSQDMNASEITSERWAVSLMGLPRGHLCRCRALP